MFHYQVAAWQCRCATWHEATKTDTIPSITNDTGSEFHINRWGWRSGFRLWPDVQQYIEMVREYNTRQLTFPADRLRAIAGLMTVWNTSFHGGFIFGLPQMFFDDALLWQPRTLLYRRIPKMFDSDKVVLPSWSGAGWEGEILSPEWASQWDYVSRAFHHGTVIWKLISTVNGPTVRVAKTANLLRCHLTDTVVVLLIHGHHSSLGWSRRPAAAGVTHHGGSASRDANSDRTEHTHFVHIRFPGVKFGYPIPLPEADQQNCSQTSPPFLFGRTRRGYFKVDRTSDKCSQVRGLDELRSQIKILHLLISLQDNNGRWAGFIQLHDETLISLLNSALKVNWRELELVSISAGTAIFSTSLRGFYNVLWIEWKEGIAYRKGLGRISKEAWERQATEWIDLTLG